jgi:DNA-binding beta-propeller fold protein YncE
MTISTRRARLVMTLITSVVLCTGCVHSAGHGTDLTAGARLGAPQIVATTRWPMPGKADYDFVTFDHAAHRLYLTRDSLVQVTRSTDGSMIGEIHGVHGAHAVVLPPGSRNGFITAEGDTAVIVFDRQTLQVIKRIRAASEEPDNAIYEPVSRRVMAFSAGGRVLVLDVESLSVVDTLTLGSGAGSAAAAGTGIVFVNLKRTSEIVAIDATHLTTVSRWRISDCKIPHGLSYDPPTRYLLVGCFGHLAVVNADSGTVVGSMSGGRLADQNAIDVERRLFYQSCGSAKSDTLCVIRLTSRTVSDWPIARVPVGDYSLIVESDTDLPGAVVPVDSAGVVHLLAFHVQ